MKNFPYEGGKVESLEGFNGNMEVANVPWSVRRCEPPKENRKGKLIVCFYRSEKLGGEEGGKADRNTSPGRRGGSDMWTIRKEKI